MPRPRPQGGVAHWDDVEAEHLERGHHGTFEPNDIAYYPRSNKLYFRGVGLIGRVEPLDYQDGEPDP